MSEPFKKLRLILSADQVREAVANLLNQADFLSHEKYFVKPEHVELTTQTRGTCDDLELVFDGVEVDLEAARKIRGPGGGRFCQGPGQARAMSDHVKIEDCVDRGLYFLFARNLAMGVYRAKLRCFVGIREKFGSEGLDIEFHDDVGPFCGTAWPERLLELCPLEDLSSGKGAGGVWQKNQPLFDWLKEMEKKYA
jgi:hypothetical protein